MNTRMQALTKVAPISYALEASYRNDSGDGLQLWFGTPKTQGSIS